MEQTTRTIENILSAISGLVPEYMKNPADEAKSGGDAAVCIIDEEGRIHGKMFGVNKNR